MAGAGVEVGVELVGLNQAGEIRAEDRLLPGSDSSEGKDIADAKAQRKTLLTTYLAKGRLGKDVHCVRRYVVSCPWLAMQMMAVISDLVVALLEFRCQRGTGQCPHRESSLFAGLTLVTSVMYCLDIGLRIYAFKCVFFRKLWNVADLCIILGTTGMAVFEVYSVSLIRGGSVFVLRTLRGFRALRGLRFAAMVTHTSQYYCQCMRQVTAQNKQRFYSLEHDFDLDLVYVTPRLVAMSVPSTGLRSLYRNPLSEVARFFELYHCGRYGIVNMCPEIPYDVSVFSTGIVECLFCQDHSPPSLEQIVRFLTWTRDCAAHPKHVMAVHCKGGKGRTGVLCCAWLMYTRETQDAEDARTFFTLARTDTTRKKKTKTKTQGVETPSQVRYLDYVEELLSEQRAYFPVTVHMPQVPQVRLDRLEADVFVRSSKELVAAVHDVSTGQIICWKEKIQGCEDAWDLDVVCTGDLRISIFSRGKLPKHSDMDVKRRFAECRGRRVPAGKEPGCVCFFFCHTLFLNGGLLRVPVFEMDNATKKRKYFKEDTFVELSYSVETNRVC